ncbi:DNA polymerase III subunit gamma and tau [Actinocrinis sp.]|uniref:DNA polymerase III subunit gamma and tau n=1 Tax=Actinocrinis sp. TaxID=1920516 RepID=UPI002D3BA40F|nr:DNA polymerase III subunit gamma and tau [Actinocrinis sp.]HZP51408.1 DNA polymerase III subunit gamma and tau [Actinocrinis sp.]
MSLALYRRYRPETFEEVIGQEHVTQPLQRALSNQRVNHAYLFSGPRGCGKTTSARILARCLNCAQGPTPTPCGTCKSCTDLARGGPGSIDVIEIDAASHGGVDDARDLRERAFFAPVSARYKIYILDEAHMVSPAGFNALLKVVEEPPPHLKFIFATTEPEKVIGTIRSRTHHYPFRLVPPGVLRDYLAQVCERESVQVDPDVLPLVVRAGAGSVRDSMSVLDQLLAGAGQDGVTYQMAVGLLGYTDATLLDEAVSAFAARDGAAAFQAVDHVVEGGHDPRRFLADLLERLRDLVILAAVPDAAEKGLITAPGDQLARMREQAAAFGPSELSRAADLVNAGLLEMRGATAPRLLLELICARVLLPSADDPVRGVAARLDRLERSGVVSAVSDVSAVGMRPDSMPAERPRMAEPAMGAAAASYGAPGAVAAGVGEPGIVAAAGQVPAGQGQQSANSVDGAFTPPWRKSGAGAGAVTGGGGGVGGAGEGGAQGAASQGAAQGLPSQGATTLGTMTQSAVPGQTRAAAAPQAGASGGGMNEAASVRQVWPQVLEAVARRSKVAWVMLQSVHVVGVEGRLLQLGFSNPGLRDNFHGSNREETLREALRELTGTEWKIDALVDPSAGTNAPGPMPSVAFPSSAPTPVTAPTAAAVPPPASPSSQGAGGGFDQAPASSSAPPPFAQPAAPPPFAQPATPPEEDEPDPDDEDVDDAGPTARDLLVRELGATVLEEKSDAD